MFTLTWDSFKYSSRQFGVWRAVFGFYLAYFYAAIIPYGTELFSNQGVYPNIDRVDISSFFPKYLLHFDSPGNVFLILTLCTLFSALIMVGLYRRLAAFGLWLLVMWLFNRAPNANSPEYAFVNWLIFALIFIPAGEKYSLGKKNPQWYMPKFFYWGAWIILSVGYFYAGSTKFKSHDPSWMDGTAMYHVFATDNARLGWYGNFFDSLPPFVFVIMTYTALFTQTLAGFLVSFRKIRPWWWVIATSTHVGLLFFVHLTQLTMGMVLFHFFIFDLGWVDQCKSLLRRIRQKLNLSSSAAL